MSPSLTPNSIATITKTDSNKTDRSLSPVVQVLKILPVAQSQGAQKERFRMIISDGVHFTQGMLATQHNHRIHSKELAPCSIIRITEYIINSVQGKNLVILLGFEIINANATKVGNPINIEKDAKLSSQTPQQSTVGVCAPNIKAEQTTSSYSNPYGSHAKNNNPYSTPNKQQQRNTPIVRTEGSLASRGITPIANLNVYQNRWTILARVTSKSDIRHWSNAKGDGQLFSIELLDASDMNIKATFFKEAVDKFHPLLEEDKVYQLSGGRLKQANPQYNTCKSNFEITFDMNSEIHLETGDTCTQIAQQTYDFCPIANLENIDPGKFVDIIGVIKSASEQSSIISKKSGKEMIKADLVVADDSGAEVNCTVWGDVAKKAATEFADNPVVAIRRARVSDFGGRTLSAGGIVISPRIGEKDRVQSWWNGGGMSGVTKSLTVSRSGGRFPNFEDRKLLCAIKDEHLGQNGGEKPDFISFKGTFSFIKSDKEGGAWYTACSNAEEPCKNRYKVNQQGDGSYYCEKCQQARPDCVRKFIFSATVSDDTSTTWVSVFDDQARSFFGDDVTADTLFEAMNEHGQDAYDAPFSKANFTDWIFTCKAKQEMVQEDMRVKITVVSIHPVDYAKEGRSLLQSILAM